MFDWLRLSGVPPTPPHPPTTATRPQLPNTLRPTPCHAPPHSAHPTPPHLTPESGLARGTIFGTGTGNLLQGAQHADSQRLPLCWVQSTRWSFPPRCIGTMWMFDWFFFQFARRGQAVTSREQHSTSRCSGPPPLPSLFVFWSSLLGPTAQWRTCWPCKWGGWPCNTSFVLFRVFIYARTKSQHIQRISEILNLFLTMIRIYEILTLA